MHLTGQTACLSCGGQAKQPNPGSELCNCFESVVNFNPQIDSVYVALDIEKIQLLIMHVSNMFIPFVELEHIEMKMVIAF